MRFIYGEANILRALEESEFWKHQESEHTDVIQEMVPDLEQEYVNILDEYKNIFDATESKIIQLIEAVINIPTMISLELYNEIMSIINLSINQSMIFSNFLGVLLSESDAIKNNPSAGALLHHMRRESEYYIGIITAFLDYMNNPNNKNR